MEIGLLSLLVFLSIIILLGHADSILNGFKIMPLKKKRMKQWRIIVVAVMYIFILKKCIPYLSDSETLYHYIDIVFWSSFVIAIIIHLVWYIKDNYIKQID